MVFAALQLSQVEDGYVPNKNKDVGIIVPKIRETGTVYMQQDER